jgi:L-malate glycosyltransferase
MKIGLLTPVSLEPLQKHLPAHAALPKDNLFPLGALLVEALLERGHTVSVFTLHHEFGSAVQTFRGDKLTVHIGGVRRKGYVRAATQYGQERRNLVEAMRGDPCDVWHAHWTYEYALAALAVDPNTLITIHDWAPLILKMQKRFQDRFYRFGRLTMNNAALRRGRYFTAPSPYIAQQVERVANKKCHIVPNALPDIYFVPEARPKRNSYQIVSINHGFDKRKNVATLLSALSIIRQHLPKAKLSLIGRGFGTGEAAHLWATENKLLDGVEWLGVQPYATIHSVLQTADLLVHPSLEESFGMTLIEAMAKRVPVVAGRESGAVPWVLAHGEAGCLVDVTSPEAIAEASLSILSDAHAWERYSAAGFQSAWEHFRLSAMVSSYLELYERTRLVPSG